MEIRKTQREALFFGSSNVAGRHIVQANRGAPGVDGMTTRELRPWIREHWAGVREALDAGTYRPLPVRRAVIPRPGGGERGVGGALCAGQVDPAGDCSGPGADLRSVFQRDLVWNPGRSLFTAEKLTKVLLGTLITQLAATAHRRRFAGNGSRNVCRSHTAVVTPASRWHSTASGSFTDTDYHVPSPPKAGQSQ
ncbi:hypothetical protein [Nonomuraea sp. B10E15]|uniref:hypothetical protein n=1 Tax=Nonomuraea sp. B10E15 TaxID=3153560 RepID=UPI00325FBF76